MLIFPLIQNQKTHGRAEEGGDRKLAARESDGVAWVDPADDRGHSAHSAAKIAGRRMKGCCLTDA